MGSRLANFASWLREVLPEPLDPWFGVRWASPMADEAHVYAVVVGGDALDLISPVDRAGLGAVQYLVEIPRRVLDAKGVRC